MILFFFKLNTRLGPSWPMQFCGPKNINWPKINLAQEPSRMYTAIFLNLCFCEM